MVKDIMNPLKGKTAEKQVKSKDCDCKKQIELYKTQIADLKSTVQHVQADFENYKKRVEKEKKEYTQFACKDFAKGILPIVDNLDRALKNTDNKDEFVKGIHLIRAQVNKFLEDYSIREINTRGAKFDPNIHEALMVEESDQEPNTITEVFETGYMINDRVLRHAKVKVAKPKQDEKDKNKED